VSGAAGILIIAAVTALGALLVLRAVSRAQRQQDLRDLAWTLGPLVIFVALAVPSLRLIHLRDNPPAADVTIRMTGRMWSWTFEYPEHGLRFAAPMLPGIPAGRDDPSAETLDRAHIVVPSGKTVRLSAVGTNVVTSWSIPDLDLDVKTLPGRVHQSWFRPLREGRYLGVCLELCALPRTFSPIEVEVVSEERFRRWIEERSARSARVDRAVQLAGDDAKTGERRLP
jgi:cytochrome c oxidase subunit 2